jgi:hypothetical protein
MNQRAIADYGIYTVGNRAREGKFKAHLRLVVAIHIEIFNAELGNETILMFICIWYWSNKQV